MQAIHEGAGGEHGDGSCAGYIIYLSMASVSISSVCVIMSE